MLLRHQPGIGWEVVLCILGGEGWSDLGVNALLGRCALGEGSTVIDALALAVLFKQLTSGAGILTVQTKIR